jgi:short-subunit dehydrogenase
MPTPRPGQWALITGASSGTGIDFAHALAEKGLHLVLTARRAEPMELLAATLRATHNIQVHVEPLDLALPGAATELHQRIAARNLTIDVLINNAAFGFIGEFVDQPLPRLTEMLQLDILALTELTHLFASEMKLRRAGHILLVGSVAAYQPCPLYTAYAASKAFLLSLGVALHSELAPHGVTVTVLSPGTMDTGFFDAAGKQPNASMRRMMIKPRTVVDLGLAALFAGRASKVAGFTNRIMSLTSRFVSHHAAAAITYRMVKE